MVEAVNTIESGQDIADYANEGASVSKPSFLNALFTAEGLIMFFLAVIVDVVEVVLDLTGVGAVVALALDIGAYAIIGGWMMSRGSDVSVSKRAGETLKKGAKQIAAIAKSAKSAKWSKRLKWMRPLLPLFELIPFVSIVPCWIVGVYFELKYGKVK